MEGTEEEKGGKNGGSYSRRKKEMEVFGEGRRKNKGVRG